MEQEALLCAKFILDLNSDGYYVDVDTLEAAKSIVNDYVSENDCSVDENWEQDDDNYNWED